MDTKQRLEEIAAAEVPLRKEYNAKREQRKAIREQVAQLVQEESTLIREIHQVSDQLEALRIEKRDLERPPRKFSRQRLRS